MLIFKSTIKYLKNKIYVSNNYLHFYLCNYVSMYPSIYIYLTNYVSNNLSIYTFNISSKTGFKVCFFTLVFLFPFLDRSGSRYTFT